MFFPSVECLYKGKLINPLTNSMISDSDFSHFIDGETECQESCFFSHKHFEDETKIGIASNYVVISASGKSAH